MRYRERLNIIFMPDHGPRKNITMRRSRFYLLILFFLCLPFITVLLLVQCWFLWQENSILKSDIEKFESDYQNAELRAEKLENLELLLQEENVEGREILLRQLAKDDTSLKTASLTDEESVLNQDGPGHDEFPVVNTGKIKIENVQVRVLRGNTLRVGLDIHNTQNEKLISGKITADLITAEGEKQPLIFPADGTDNFKINRFKRTVITTRTPEGISLVNARIILEVREQNGEILFQNIYDLQR